MTSTAEAAFLSDNPRAYAATASSLCVQDQSRRQARLTESLGDRPLAIIATEDSEDAEANAYWTGVVQRRLKNLSERGTLTVVSADDTHFLPAIIAAIRDVIRGFSGG